ncbi:hypothetical protein PanWU01x14_018200 [Parasponia andersonii]|uniref:Uncharacterized protein n=1 Tax=Parasponia andersonii TaxID=3476 RepID=A0A2P5DZ41_PARAD|nr:hypothetical protein PanWU01x14_018200 [Parasponia andersonii]
MNSAGYPERNVKRCAAAASLTVQPGQLPAKLPYAAYCPPRRSYEATELSLPKNAINGHVGVSISGDDFGRLRKKKNVHQPAVIATVKRASVIATVKRATVIAIVKRTAVIAFHGIHKNVLVPDAVIGLGYEGTVEGLPKRGAVEGLPNRLLGAVKDIFHGAC